jgi:multidrug transporter EmrE-like cation transporter
MPFIPLLLASGMAGIDVLAFSTIKKVSEGALAPIFTLLAMGLYSLQPIILLRAMPFETIAVMNILWNLISCVVVTLVSIWFLGETISTIKMYGILLGIVSLFLFTYEEGRSEINKYYTIVKSA